MQDEFGPHSTDAIWAAARVAEAYVRRLQRGEGELRGQREHGIWRNPDFVDQQLLIFWRTLQYLRRPDRDRQLAAHIAHHALHYQYLQDDDDPNAIIDNPYDYGPAPSHGPAPRAAPIRRSRARGAAAAAAADDTDDDFLDNLTDDDDYFFANLPAEADPTASEFDTESLPDSDLDLEYEPESDTDSESVYYDAAPYDDDDDNTNIAADAAVADADAGGH